MKNMNISRKRQKKKKSLDAWIRQEWFLCKKNRRSDGRHPGGRQRGELTAVRVQQ